MTMTLGNQLLIDDEEHGSGSKSQSVTYGIIMQIAGRAIADDCRHHLHKSG
ncbi:hypothetical protein D3C71_2045890 [compost metagenome]